MSSTSTNNLPQSDLSLVTQFIDSVSVNGIGPLFEDLILIFSIISPSLLLICYIIRLFTDMKNSEPYNLGLYDLLIAGVYVGAYALFANTIIDVFNAFDEFTGYQTTGGLANNIEVMFTDYKNNLEQGLKDSNLSQGVFEKMANQLKALSALVLSMPIKLFEIFLDLLLSILNVLMFLAQSLMIALGLAWGLIAIPTKVLPSGGFISGAYKIFQIVLAWKFVLFIFSLIITQVFTVAFNTLLQTSLQTSSVSTWDIYGPQMSMLILLIKGIVIILTLIAPFIAIGLISNTGGVAPMAAGMSALGFMVTKRIIGGMKTATANAIPSNMSQKITNAIQQSGGQSQGQSLGQSGGQSQGQSGGQSQGQSGGQSQGQSGGQSQGQSSSIRKRAIQGNPTPGESQQDDNRGGSQSYVNPYKQRK